MPAQLDGDTEGMKTSTGALPAERRLEIGEILRRAASWPMYLIGPVQANLACAEPECAPSL